MQPKECDIIIPVWDEPEATKECIDKLRERTTYPYRLIIIDNGSKEPTRHYLEGLKEIWPKFLLIRNSANLGFVKAVNQGMLASRAPYVCVLNNDCVVSKNWLSLLVETVEHGPDNIGIANPASNVFGKAAPFGAKVEWQELDSARGFCMLIKREVIERAGLFDEIYGMGYFEEKDYSRRAIEAGYICVMVKSSYVYHTDRLSFDKIKDRNEIFKRNESIYIKKWGRSLSIALVEKDTRRMSEAKGLVYRLLEKGHRANIFFPGRKALADFKDHIQIRYFNMPTYAFGYFSLWRICSRRRKKKIDVIASSDAAISDFFKKFAPFHGADVVSGNGQDVFAFCEKVSHAVYEEI